MQNENEYKIKNDNYRKVISKLFYTKNAGLYIKEDKNWIFDYFPAEDYKFVDKILDEMICKFQVYSVYASKSKYHDDLTLDDTVEYNKKTLDKEYYTPAYTTYYVNQIIDDTLSIDQLRVWAGKHQVYKSNTYLFTAYELDLLLKRFDLTERFNKKKKHSIKLSEFEKKFIIDVKLGKENTPSNFDVTYFYKRIPIEERLRIKVLNKYKLTKSENDFLKQKRDEDIELIRDTVCYVKNEINKEAEKQKKLKLGNIISTFILILIGLFILCIKFCAKIFL